VVAVLLFDIREIIRTLARDRSYAATVVLTLALTIGATTAMFSIVDGVLLKPLSYRQPQRLVSIGEIWQQLVARVPRLPVNERHFEYWRDHARSFDAMAQYLSLPANLTGRGEASQIGLVRASGSLFDVLGVTAAIGRTLTPDDQGEERRNVTVVTDAFWRQRLGGDRAVVGRSITLDGTPYTIVGVLPPDFRLPIGGQLSAEFDAIVPLRVSVGWVGDHNNAAIGRLKAGVSVEQARSELDLLQSQVSDIATREAHEPVTLSSTVMPLAEAVVGEARRGLLLLFGAIAAVLLIACSNLANLALSRAVGRLRDAAIRSALGASRQRLVVRAVAEQVMLAIVGGALGVWVAWLAIAAFVRTAPVDLPRVADVALDGRVLLFSACLAIVTGFLVAVLPALGEARRDAQSVLRSGGAAVASERSGMRTRHTLLAMQVALSVTLLVVTTLLTASLLRVLRVETGLSAERVLAVAIALPPSRYADDHARLAVYDRLLANVSSLPGVQSASTISLLPFAGGGQVNFVVPDGVVVPRSEQASANFRFVGPDYFRTVGIAVRRGRSFLASERDPNRPTPSVVSEATANRLWPGEDPIGKRFSRGIEQEKGFEVVGVTIDAHTTSLERESPLMVYLPYWWRPRTATSLVVKTPADPAALIATVRRAIADVDAEIAVGETRTLVELVERSLAPRRYQAGLFIAFAVAALLIVTIGVYGVTAYGVARRRREMNIRAALGAETSRVLGMIVRQSSVPVAAGAVAGVVGALAIGGTIRNLLFGVVATDPTIIGSVVVLVAGVGPHRTRGRPARSVAWNRLPAHRLSILPMIRPGAVHAVHRQFLARRARVEDRLRQPRIAREQDALIPAHRAAAHGSHLVAFGLQRGPHQVEERGLERQRVGVLIVREARGVGGHLHVHPEVDEIHHVLRVRLGLDASAHVAERHQGLAVLHHEARDDGVEGAFAWRDEVRALGIE
jgi:putative ABC transport system permease protein